MNKNLNNLSGVSVLLSNNKIIFKSGNTFVNMTILSDFFFLKNKTNISKNFVLFTPINAITSKCTLNTNTVQKSQKTYYKDTGFLTFGALDKLRWFFYKFKYQGKGLKVKKSTNRSTILFNLGSSHISKIIYNSGITSVLRTKKNTYTVVFFKKSKFFSNSLVKKIRPYNIYTKRGLRITRQPMHRRFGKVSQLAPKKR